MSENLLPVLIRSLLQERPDLHADFAALPDDRAEQLRIYRSLVNIRPAMPASADFLRAEDTFLQAETAAKGITDYHDLTPAEPHIYLWRGDITTLRCGAIVNAANSGMTGCWAPCHTCIDNCIHTYAGVRLRIECDRQMRAQGHEEPTGRARLTPAYNLPCEWVIHTVGPIVEDALTDRHRALLRSCYESCLRCAAENQIESIAFCCISTGVFGFPKQPAAEIAVQTVRDFCKAHDLNVIFNVFSESDHALYRRILTQS